MVPAASGMTAATAMGTAAATTTTAAASEPECQDRKSVV
jgi:hypothetical protein